jgi:pantoate--beta-alanine ligase
MKVVLEMSHTSSPKTIVKSSDMVALADTWTKAGKTIGFVPTMGALHEGHLSLVREAISRCDHVITSIFVNPIQFGPNEDFAKYPRTLTSDVELLSRMGGCDAVFVPNAADIFPKNFSTNIQPLVGGNILCGPFRTGHFEGVLTIVNKLLNLTRASEVFLGKKDYQQFLLITKMVQDLNMPATVVGIETKRETDGLAMSSRNRYLSSSDRQVASEIYLAITAVGVLWTKGRRDPKDLASCFAEIVNKSSMFRIQYAELIEVASLCRMSKEPTTKGLYVFAVAVFLGEVRLIDNIELEL